MLDLVNGDRLRGSVAGVSGKKLTIDSRSFGSIKVGIQTVSAIRFAPGNIEESAGTGSKRMAEGDTVVFANGDSLNGTVTDISATGIVLESVLGRMHYTFADLFSITFDRPATSGHTVQDTFFRIVTATGESVSGREMEQKEGRTVIHSLNVGDISVAGSVLAVLKVENGRFVYLSDLVPSDAEERSFWKGGYIWHYKKDRSVDGNRLKLKSREYYKGIGVHSYCRLAYRLNGAYVKFVATAGIDSEVTEYGNADIIIRGDGRILFERKHVDAASTPVSIAVDVSSVGTLELIADFGELFDIGDHVDWAGAYLIKKKKSGDIK
jgi:hypothetical protein